MTELEIMKRAQMYIDSLAKGVDPLTGQAVKDDDIIRNIRISRCLFYVSDVLKKVIDNGGEVSADKKKKSAISKAYFSLTPEQITSLIPIAGEQSAGKIVAKINTLIDDEQMQKLTATSLTAWLVSAGLLCETVSQSGSKRKIPTEDGKMLGMREAVFHDAVRGDVKYVTYNKNAQQFIFDNLEAIIEVCKMESEQKALLKQQKIENKGKPWSQVDDDSLSQMYQNGSSLKDMAAYFKRTRSAIKARLVLLGLLEDSNWQWRK